MDAPDITELLETIQELSGALAVAIRYCEHPDVKSMPFSLNSQCAADRGESALNKARDILDRAQ